MPAHARPGGYEQRQLAETLKTSEVVVKQATWREHDNEPAGLGLAARPTFRSKETA